MSLEERYKKQVDIFLQNDQHASDIIRLFQAIELAFEKLKPYCKKHTQKRFETALGDLQRDLSRHMYKHLETVVKNNNDAKSN